MPETLPRVLVVEDDDATAEMFSEMLVLSGNDVQRAKDGRQAMAALSARRPDLILLDLMMPDLDGLAFLAQLRADVRTHNLPVIVISAKGLPSDIDTAMTAGAVAYFTKPVSFQELKAAVSRALRAAES
ncbi:MAG: response regulator [Anaerolineae bacterium]|nr:MAG: response regulator [Anaerolineae bacterium]